MKFETILKTWSVEKIRWQFTIDLMHDFTVRSTSKYGENLYNPNAFITEWFGFSSDKKTEIDIIIEIMSLMPTSMMSEEVKRIAEFYVNYIPTEPWTNSNLRPDQEFFTGPRIHSLPLTDRILIKKRYFESTQNAFKLSDGFILFDYSKISFSKDVSNDSGGEDYFRIVDGKVIYGGFDNTGNGGEQSWDLESIYYWPESIFNLLTNQRFIGTQKEVKEIMDKYIVTA